MKHLIIFAHPNSRSFGAAIADTVRKVSAEKGADTRFLDLYEEKFNPVLSGADFEAVGNGNTPEDIKKGQELVEWADVLTFVYPVWWAGLPAILKGFIDRVFLYGFAYVSGEEGVKGLLGGRKVLLLSTSGTPSEIYAENGMHKSMKQTQDDGIFRFSGIDDVKHFFFGAVPYVENATREGYLKEVEKIIAENL